MFGDGGLNGDGFFGEEYMDGRDEYDITPIPARRIGLVRTEVETEKALLFQYKGLGTLWLPKSAFTNWKYTHINHWAYKIVCTNIMKLRET